MNIIDAIKSEQPEGFNRRAALFADKENRLKIIKQEMRYVIQKDPEIAEYFNSVVLTEEEAEIISSWVWPSHISDMFKYLMSTGKITCEKIVALLADKLSERNYNSEIGMISDLLSDLAFRELFSSNGSFTNIKTKYHGWNNEDIHLFFCDQEINNMSALEAILSALGFAQNNILSVRNLDYVWLMKGSSPTCSDCFVFHKPSEFIIDSGNLNLEGSIKAPKIKIINTNLSSGINCRDIDSIEVDGDCAISIKRESSCVATQNPEFTIKGSGTLKLSCEDRSTCIGPQVHGGMSYGRYTPADGGDLKRLIIDGVQVICESTTANFAIGSYGRSYQPEIVCINGGSIACPEATGKRELKSKGIESCGSTKIEGSATYEMAAVQKTTKQLDTF